LAAQAIAPNTDTAISFESVLQTRDFVGSAVPFAHIYAIEVWFAIAGLSAGEEVAIAFTVDDAVWRQGYFQAGGSARETFQLHCAAPLPAGGRVGARVRIRAGAERTILGGPGFAGFSIIALT
jgi:hypothetical protein